MCIRDRDRISEFTKLVITGNAKNPNIYAAMLLGRAEEREMNLSLVAEIEKTGKQVRYSEIQPGLGQKTLEELVRIVQLWQQEIGALKREPVSIDVYKRQRQGSGEERVVLLRNILIQVLSEAASCCIKTEDDAGHKPKRVSQWKHKPPARFSHRSCDAVCNSLTLPVNGTSRDTSVPVGHAPVSYTHLLTTSCSYTKS